MKILQIFFILSIVNNIITPSHFVNCFMHNILHSDTSSTRCIPSTILSSYSTLLMNNNLNYYSVGIDLGTTYSLISIINRETQKPKIIPINNKTMIPSVVSFYNNFTYNVGYHAQNNEIINPQNTFSSTKRIIGKSIKEVKKIDELAFTSKLVFNNNNVKNINNDLLFNNSCYLSCPAWNTIITPENISSLIIKELIIEATKYLKHINKIKNPIISRAVITVPAYFSQNQRDATERAGLLAGLEKVKLLREPEAAALAYGLNLHQQQLVLVFDLGGGTLDISVLEVGNGFVEVIATNGDSHLGGDDFDYIIVQWIIDKFMEISKEGGLYIRKDIKTYTKLREIAQLAKKDLSTSKEVMIHIPCLYKDINFPPTKLTRGRFEALSKGLLTRALKPLREVAIMAGINLPGESGQIGLLAFDDDDDEDNNKNDNKDINNNDNNKEFNINTLRDVQLQGRRESKDKKKLKGSTGKELRRLQKEYSDPSLSIFPGGQSINEVLLVGGATRMPAVRQLVRTITGVDPLKSVNPDEAVCLGAGILAGVLDGIIPDMQVMSSWQAAILRTIYEEKLKGNNIYSIQESSNMLDSKTVIQDNESSSVAKSRKLFKVLKLKNK